MNKEIIINNILIIDENIKTNNNTVSPSFKPLKNKYSIKQCSMQKTKVSQNTIIINGEIMGAQNLVKDLENSDTKFDDQSTKSDISIVIPLVDLTKSSKKYSSKKNKPFEINYIKKIGRKPKTSIMKSNHTKFSHDNILRKLKVKFFSKFINYINSLILSKYRNKIKILKPLKGELSQNNNIKFNNNLLNTKLKDIFSSYEINGKFKLKDKYYNKEVINSIYEGNISELINIFEMTFFEIFQIFRDLNENEKLNGMEKLDSVIREIKLKENNEEYLNKFKSVAMNFENYYLCKNARKP